jgi:hypothetical protein
MSICFSINFVKFKIVKLRAKRTLIIFQWKKYMVYQTSYHNHAENITTHTPTFLSREVDLLSLLFWSNKLTAIYIRSNQIKVDMSHVFRGCCHDVNDPSIRFVVSCKEEKNATCMYTLASGSFRLAVGLDLDRLVLVSWCRLAPSNKGRDRTGNTMHARLTFVWPKPIDRDTLDFCSLMHVCIIVLTPKPIFTFRRISMCVYFFRKTGNVPRFYYEITKPQRLLHHTTHPVQQTKF